MDNKKYLSYRDTYTINIFILKNLCIFSDKSLRLIATAMVASTYPALLPTSYLIPSNSEA